LWAAESWARRQPPPFLLPVELPFNLSAPFYPYLAPVLSKALARNITHPTQTPLLPSCCELTSDTDPDHFPRHRRFHHYRSRICLSPSPHYGLPCPLPRYHCCTGTEEYLVPLPFSPPLSPFFFLNPPPVVEKICVKTTSMHECLVVPSEPFQ